MEAGPLDSGGVSASVSRRCGGGSQSRRALARSATVSVEAKKYEAESTQPITTELGDVGRIDANAVETVGDATLIRLPGLSWDRHRQCLGGRGAALGRSKWLRRDFGGSKAEHIGVDLGKFVRGRRLRCGTEPSGLSLRGPRQRTLV